MTALSEYTTHKLGDIKQLIANCVQIALEDEDSQFFKTCEELHHLRNALDPRELRSEHIKWHRKDNWLLVGKEIIDSPYASNPDNKRLPYQLKLEFDAGLYKAWVTVCNFPAPEGDIRNIDVLIGAFWAPEHQPPTGPIRVRG